MIRNNYQPTVALLVIITALCSCASTTSTIAVGLNDIPISSSEPTPFEGTWVHKGFRHVDGGTNISYMQFHGNNYVLRTSTNLGTDVWEVGIFKYTDENIIFYPSILYDTILFNEIMTPDSVRQKKPLRWRKPHESTTFLKKITFSDLKVNNDQTTMTTVSFSYSTDYLLIGGNDLWERNPQYIKTNEKIKMPEDFVFFYNGNNYLTQDEGALLGGVKYLFTITEINDISINIKVGPNGAQQVLGTNIVSGLVPGGYLPAEQREPGLYKISFKQTSRKVEENNMGQKFETSYSGHFSKHFEPGIYEFSLAVDPSNNISRIYCQRRNITGRINEASNVITEYIDIQLNP